MLTPLDPGHRYCDGVSRRSSLKIGGLAIVGLGLPKRLRAEAATCPGKGAHAQVGHHNLPFGGIFTSGYVRKAGGRDHRATVNGALLAGGGMRVGRAAGATARPGGSAVGHPVHHHDVLATVYHNPGIDPHAFLRDESGRPMMNLPGTARPIAELL